MKIVENPNGRWGKKYTEWKYRVFVRDNFKCQHCGINENLHPHHIIKWENEDLRYDVSNGLTLCRSCHFKIHHKNREPWNKGKKMNEEQRKKLSLAHLGQKAWNKGIPQTEEVKQKLSAANKGRILGIRSEEWKRKIGEANIETLRKIAASNKGKKRIKCLETGKLKWV